MGTITLDSLNLPSPALARQILSGSVPEELESPHYLIGYLSGVVHRMPVRSRLTAKAVLALLEEQVKRLEDSK